MKLSEFLELEQKQKNKYHNRKVVLPNGETYASEKEYKRWCELQLMEKAGLISDLQKQVRFELIPKQPGERACYYVADFVYNDKNGKHVVEDAKGKRTKDYVIKRKLMLEVHGIKIVEV